ncbi:MULTISPECIES: hypothetical protein [unclassified Fibrobacter]|uniref:hypothetical protein n=1 Tax=unclassified Fibrobacter TaxID=2634177 RepID=UPI000D790953|nr:MULTISPECIES: hypothetical protein [unclassified Fibrobacter]PWJ56880.1 hypothetical protein BGX12_1592 [Fibrobacter sp. UWR4]PZW62713.1 hypothetical protein C8E88_10584 [Fibrobacter sp. UWR1]
MATFDVYLGWRRCSSLQEKRTGLQLELLVGPVKDFVAPLSFVKLHKSFALGNFI